MVSSHKVLLAHIKRTAEIQTIMGRLCACGNTILTIGVYTSKERKVFHFTYGKAKVTIGSNIY
jgi:hypothetical protein